MTLPGTTGSVVVSPSCTLLFPDSSALAIPDESWESWRHDAPPAVQHVDLSINKHVGT